MSSKIPKQEAKNIVRLILKIFKNHHANQNYTSRKYFNLCVNKHQSKNWFEKRNLPRMQQTTNLLNLRIFELGTQTSRSIQHGDQCRLCRGRGSN